MKNRLGFRGVFAMGLALSLSPVWADFDAGLAAFSKKDYAAALTEWQSLADKGEARAQLRIGLMYAFGIGIKRNPPEAEKWLVQAIQNKADLNETDVQGNTALCYAAGNNMQSLAELLISGGAEIDLPGSEKQTPLFCAADEGRKEMVELLLKKGADPRKTDVHGKNPLHVTVELYNESIAGAIVDLLMAHGVDLQAVDADGNTALHSAVDRGHLKLIDRLIDQGIQPNVANTRGETPLLKVIERGAEPENLSLLEKLLAKGADINAKDKEGRGVLHLLAKSADHKKSLKILEFLLQHKADVNQVDGNGRTPLHVALKSRSGRTTPLNFVVALLDKGANVKARDKSGDAPIHLALIPGDAAKSIALLDALLAKGADVNAVNEHGETPLHFLMYRPGDKGVEAIAAYLLSKGANPNAGDKKKQTPLHLLAGNDNDKETSGPVALLLANKADPSAVDEELRSPLHVAAHRGSRAVAKALIAKGARSDVKDKYGRTAFMEADSNGRKEVKEIMRLGTPGMSLPPAPVSASNRADQDKQAALICDALAQANPSDKDFMERGLLQLADQCPDTEKAPDALWKLSNLYLFELREPEYEKASEVLEKLNQKYPSFKDFVPKPEPSGVLKPVIKRLGFVYEKMGNDAKIVEIYGPLFSGTKSLSTADYCAYGLPYADALGRSDGKDNAVTIYREIIKRDKDPDAVAAKVARERLSQLK